MTALLTPAQTAGPYLAIGLPWLDGPFVVPEGTPGAITITGAIWDGAGSRSTTRWSRPGRPTRTAASTTPATRAAGGRRSPRSAASAAA